MKESFNISEVISWDKINEFTFETVQELKDNLKMLLLLKKINKSKRYKVIIEEI